MQTVPATPGACGAFFGKEEEECREKQKKTNTFFSKIVARPFGNLSVCVKSVPATPGACGAFFGEEEKSGEKRREKEEDEDEDFFLSNCGPTLWEFQCVCEDRACHPRGRRRFLWW